MWGQKNGVSAPDRGGESHNGGVPNTPAGVARQGKAGQGGEGGEDIGKYWGGGAPEEAERSMMVFSVWAARPA